MVKFLTPIFLGGKSYDSLEMARQGTESFRAPEETVSVDYAKGLVTVTRTVNDRLFEVDIPITQVIITYIRSLS